MNCMANNLVGLLTVKMFIILYSHIPLLAETLFHLSVTECSLVSHNSYFITKKNASYLYDSPTLITIAFTFVQAIFCPHCAYFGTVEKILQALCGVSLFFPLP